MVKSKDKEKILTAGNEKKKKDNYKGTHIELSADFSQMCCKPERSGKHIFHTNGNDKKVEVAIFILVK